MKEAIINLLVKLGLWSEHTVDTALANLQKSLDSLEAAEAKHLAQAREAQQLAREAQAVADAEHDNAERAARVADKLVDLLS